MIATGNAVALSSIKGIGAKTAQRIIVDLKDKIIKLNVVSDIDTQQHQPSGEVRDEAVSALVMLGFAANVSQKAVDGILKTHSDVSVEQLIKLALKSI
jgi:Holliday junction DNA helicase RuvA